ncbi:MAG: ATP-binding protein, partial [Bacteroidota bacterium]
KKSQMSKELLAKLEQIPALKGVPNDQLNWLITNAKCHTLAVGEHLFKKGEAIDHLFIITKGHFMIRVSQNQQFRNVGTIEEMEISGNLPYSRAKEATGYAEAGIESEVISLHKDHFQFMIRHHHELTEKLVHVMSARIRKFTKVEQQNDKMMALGKLSAGLSHELNNPSAAVVRSARALKKHLGLLPDKFKRVIKIRMDDAQVDAVNDLLFSKISSSQTLSLMEKTELEEEVAEWLEDIGIEDGYELAENFVDFQLTTDDLETIKTMVSDEDLPPVLEWVNQLFTTEKLVHEIEDASQRINDLVSSVKSYTHMDQAPERIPANIHTGIDNTITMLNHKINRANIKIDKQYEENLPLPKIFVSEMNQVWTNLIDNAIDAMKDTSGDHKLEVITRSEGEFVKTSIVDNGTGIPEEVIESIFDPFFTTKKIGEGTGLGLDVVQQIIKQHNGTIDVKSKPGRTEFKICIPLA